jgi:hypothetical protein
MLLLPRSYNLAPGIGLTVGIRELQIATEDTITAKKT